MLRRPPRCLVVRTSAGRWRADVRRPRGRRLVTPEPQLAECDYRDAPFVSRKPFGSNRVASMPMKTDVGEGAPYVHHRTPSVVCVSVSRSSSPRLVVSGPKRTKPADHVAQQQALLMAKHGRFTSTPISPRQLAGTGGVAIASGYRSRHATSVAELLSRRLVSMSAVTISAGYGRCCARSRPRWWARR